MTFMAELFNIATKILKKSHLSTNITEKSSEDLIDSPGWYKYTKKSQILTVIHIQAKKRPKTNIYQATLNPYPWNTCNQLQADYGVINLHISINIHGMYASSAVMVTGNKLYPKLVYILAVFDRNGFIVSFFDQCFFEKNLKEHGSNFITLEYRHALSF